MKHILKQRMMINESEKNRILGLHEITRKKSLGILTEATIDDATKYFEGEKAKFTDFPTTGKVVPYNNSFGYEVTNPDGTKYILMLDNTAYIDNGTGYKLSQGYKWTDTPYVEKPITAPPPSSSPSSSSNTNQTSTLTPLKSKKEIRQGYNQRVKDANTLKKEREDKIKTIQNEIDKYTNYLNNAKLKAKMTPEDIKGYEDYVKLKKTELDQLKKTPLNSANAQTNNTATLPPKPVRSAEDRSAIEAGQGL
jgi:hypothetical protein